MIYNYLSRRDVMLVVKDGLMIFKLHGSAMFTKHG